jgi:hypothetical protein
VTIKGEIAFDPQTGKVRSGSGVINTMEELRAALAAEQIAGRRLDLLLTRGTAPEPDLTRGKMVSSVANIIKDIYGHPTLKLKDFMYLGISESAFNRANGEAGYTRPYDPYRRQG